MADSIPRLAVLGRPNTTTYLQYVLAKGRDHRRMQLSSPVVASASNFTRLEVVRAPNSVGQNMVHIRSAYNNKYLVLESEASNFFVAGADEVDEDRSKWSCTLFRVASGANGTFSFFHQSRAAQSSVQISSSCLSIVRNSSASYWFQVTDMSSLPILPKYVAFKGDNSLYLSAQYRRLNYRLFYGSNNILDPTVHHETITLPNGDIRLKSLEFGELWRKSSKEWIFTDGNKNSTFDRDTTYRPVRLSSQDSTIALQSVGNNKYCMRWVQRGQPRLIDTLTATSTRVGDSLARMTVEEAVRDREITNIRYKLEDARTYNTVLSEDGGLEQDVYNYGNHMAVQRAGFTFTKSTHETFTSSHSWKLSYTATLNVTVIPVLVEAEIVLDATYEGKVEWSKTKYTSRATHSDVFVPVPPRSKVTVTMVSGHGFIDVPFSYTQHDILPDNSRVSNNFDDGLFTGRNMLVTYKISEATPLSAFELDESTRDSLELDSPEEDLPPPPSE